MSKQKRSRFGSVVKMAGRDGWWCRFREGGKVKTRKGGTTEGAAKDKRTRVRAKVLEGKALWVAVAEVWGEPTPRGRGSNSHL